jgi:hypothetical protein
VRAQVTGAMWGLFLGLLLFLFLRLWTIRILRLRFVTIYVRSHESWMLDLQL